MIKYDSRFTIESTKITMIIQSIILNIEMNLGGVHNANPKESKNFDHDFGFNIFKLSKNEANKVAKLLIKDAQKHVGPRFK